MVQSSCSVLLRSRLSFVRNLTIAALLKVYQSLGGTGVANPSQGFTALAGKFFIVSVFRAGRKRVVVLDRY